MTVGKEFKYDARGAASRLAAMLPWATTAKWQQRVSDIGDRHQAIDAVRRDWEKYEGIGGAAPELSFVDVFVEYAQDRLTLKANVFYAFGVALAIAVALILGYAYQHVSGSDVMLLFAQLEVSRRSLDPLVLFFVFMRNVGLAALVGGGAYFLGSLSTACLHEATILLNRRHALRQGRLYMYLKLIGAPGGSPEPAEALTVDELEQAFGWNLQSSTAFRSIKLDPLTASIYAKAIEAVTKPFAPAGGAAK